MTPAKYRKNQAGIPLYKRLNFLDFQSDGSSLLTMSKPVLKHISRRYICGHEYQTSLNGNKHYQDIAGFYKKVIPLVSLGAFAKET
ncbi:hypothetical protein SAMN06264849_106121 [Melghirimyces algeriensis]|uniref:Uncharacterized protein n=2 Tax=Melghirimyces algeriensis TaxID=910412 RepID=A0A521DL41_9BACL|nr:hypothetical protein SAMN06264849_106121 [Melghirimyces algeriensis]